MNQGLLYDPQNLSYNKDKISKTTTKCKACTNKLKMVNIDSRVVSSRASNEHIYNLTISEYQLIWSIIFGNHYPNNYFTSYKLFDRLIDYASLPYLDKSPNIYDLYMVCKPTNITDPNYIYLSEFSKNTLLDIIREKLPKSNRNYILENQPIDQLEQLASHLLNQNLKDIYTGNNPYDYILDNLNSMGYSEISLVFQESNWYTNSIPIWKRHSEKRKSEMITNNTILDNNLLKTRDEIVADLCLRVLNSNILAPRCPKNYKYSSKFLRQMNHWILSETVLRRFVWSFLKIFYLAEHRLLLKTLSLRQLQTIEICQNLCQLLQVSDMSSTWKTFLSNIGEVLICRAINQAGECKSMGLLNSYQIQNEFNHPIQILRYWYDHDRDYALVALSNSLDIEGNINICSLTLQIQARYNSGFVK